MTIFCWPTADNVVSEAEDRRWWEEGVKAQNAAWQKQSTTEKTEDKVKTEIAKITAKPKPKK